MDQPVTRAEFKRFVEEQERLKEEVRQLREQRTEEIRAVRVEVASEDVIKRLDDLKQELTQELKTVSETWLDTLQEHYTEHKRDISDIKTVQSGHSKFFEEHGKRLAATATKEDLGKLETRIDRIETTMATKDDIAALQTTQQRQEQLLQAILDRLPPKP